MQLTNIQICTETEQKIREFIPYIHSEEDMAFVIDWFLIMGLGLVRCSLEKHPHLSIGDLMNMTMRESSNFNH